MKEKKNFTFMPLKLYAWPQTNLSPTKVSYTYDNPPQLHLIKVRGSFPWLCPKHSPSQAPAIHSYHAPFSLHVQHPNHFFKSFTVSYKSTSVMVNLLCSFLHTHKETSRKEQKIGILKSSQAAKVKAKIVLPPTQPR